MAWLTISVNSIADHTVSAPCKPTVQRAPGRDKRPTWASSWDYPRHRRAHEGAPSLLREHATSLLRRPIAARPHTRACDAQRRARPRAPADNLPSVESNSPFARTRVADERVACEAMAAVGGAHAALVYLAAEGRAGGYDLCVTRGAAQAPTRLNPVARAALTCGAAATGPYVRRPRSRPTGLRSLRARACRTRRHACGRTHSPSGAPTAFALGCVGCVRTLHVPFSSR